jgi:hypothetical protein
MIPAEEITGVFRRALRGEIAVTLDDDATWNDAYCGNVCFRFGDWSITVYNDCSEFDYVDSATAPDGRTVEFDDWEWDADPVALLTEQELAGMETLVEGLELT